MMSKQKRAVQCSAVQCVRQHMPACMYQIRVDILVYYVDAREGNERHKDRSLTSPLLYHYADAGEDADTPRALCSHETWGVPQELPNLHRTKQKACHPPYRQQP